MLLKYENISFLNEDLTFAQTINARYLSFENAVGTIYKLIIDLILLHFVREDDLRLTTSFITITKKHEDETFKFTSVEYDEAGYCHSFRGSRPVISSSI